MLDPIPLQRAQVVRVAQLGPQFFEDDPVPLLPLASETRPANAERAGSVSSALAVRSSSHEAITLPRRQTSAMSRMLKSYWYSSGLRSGVVSASTACSDLPTLA